ncbi:glycoside hydrolase family 127 protein [Seonamhaeicola marinus]|uniref:Glycoside hydrolase family 127 protein n=1 Tax=Seonamhaeicola marinus TaxID=1912246 RepID=A0A5D0J7G0_9FLAO|nr:beta-L-arabinofuranosidase domain-containing protein [Seonamhaeicola marinus]TYA92123.1 glycoside hydrolase family 127 protein [Seonamhaeicola marinus]
MKLKILFIISIILVNVSFSQEKGIVNTSESNHVKFKSINIGDCQWTEGFWADKFKIAQESMVPYMEQVLTGDVGHALNNFKIAAGLKEGKHKGMHWHDGDFYKWIEAATYVYAINKDEELLKRLEAYIQIIAKAQQPNGFLQTQISIRGIEPFSNRRYHEMYNSGHLYIAACIYYRVTGRKSFLDIAIKHANNLYETFEPQPEHLKRFGFNQVQIMGLVELYRTTKDKRYLELAEIFVNMRGQSKVVPDETVRHRMIGDMVQERTPLREETEAVGHAVLGLYMWAGAADIYAETGEKPLIDALDRIWNNIVDKKMYITGACGQVHDGASSNRDFVHEAFTLDYQMHNADSYNETCANLCNAMFNYRLLGVHGESKYADVIETVMFNSGLSGIDLKGVNYFYTNPLRRSLGHDMGITDYPNRVPYIPCFCCPPNLVRTISKLSGWAYSLTDNGVVVNLYGGNKLDTKMLDGSRLKLHQQTQYPWKGSVKITIDQAKKKAFDVLLRIPEWAKGTSILINGEHADIVIKAGTFAVIHRIWKKGDVITINMPMEAKLYEGHPQIEEVRNQVAIKRGPVVYCAESPDLPENTKITDVYLPLESKLNVTHKPDFLGGVTTINAEVKLKKDKSQAMYRELNNTNWETKTIQLVPYFAWSNRGLAEMSVWLPLIWQK